LRADRVYDGAVFGMFALFGVAFVITLVVVGLERKLDAEAHRRAGRALLGILGIGVVVLLVAFVVAVGNPVAWASNEISASKSCQQVANTPGRFGNVSANGRLCWWREAWRIFANNAPGGTGAGSFEVARKRYRINAGTVTEPHSVPMQELSDGGVVAFALFLAVVASGAAVSVSALRRLGGPERAAAVALIGVPAAYLVHALVDFSWDFLATTAPTMVALGVLAGSGKPSLERRTRPYLGIAAAVVAVAALVSFASPRLSDSSVAASTSDLGYGQLAKARQRARWARILNPLSIEPIWALAAVDERNHHEAAALARYEQAVRLQPRNPDTWFALALYEYQVPPISLCLAYRYFNNAWTLDPRGAEWTQGGPLDVSRAAVNKGACKGVITPLPPPVGSYGPAD
jgi:hypothetical protein